jgi:hypothetical protein
MPLTLPQKLDFSLNASEHILRISNEVLAHFQKNRQNHPHKKEVGGQLFGTFDSKLTTITPQLVSTHDGEWLSYSGIKKLQ